ncbi:MAG: hypothetical protein GYB35_08290 [Algicola sp.]|nr:hypothetical protein [Algicola sp.]
MEFIAEFFIEIIFRGLIVHVFGVYPRYYFFKFVGKQKDIKYLSGESQLYDSTDIIQQHVFNIVIGFINFAMLCFVTLYIVYEMF